MWLYELFVLPVDTSPDTIVSPIRIEDTSSVRVKGEYSFGSEGVSVSIGISGEGWESRIKATDAAGISGEVKRVEDLQELSILFERGGYSLRGGILTEDLITGRVRGEGIEVSGKSASLLYLRRYAPVIRREVPLTGNYPGPYTFSDRPVVRNSVRVYINGRPLKDGDYRLLPEGNALYLLVPFNDGDLLTVEYQPASLSPSHVLTARLGTGRVGLSLYHERPAVKVINGCVFSNGGDYVLKGDTFLLTPGKGNLSCTFVPSEGGEYSFTGNGYVRTDSGGYRLVPPDTSPRTTLGTLTLSGRDGEVRILGGKVGDAPTYGTVWEVRSGSKLYLSTSGDLSYGPRPTVVRYNRGLWRGDKYGEARIGVGYGSEGTSLFGEVVSGVGKRTEVGYRLKGAYRMLFGEYSLFPVRRWGRVGVKVRGIEAHYHFYRDTATAYRGVEMRGKGITADVRRYDDGFLGYSLSLRVRRLSLYYSTTPIGRSLMGNVGITWGRISVRGGVRSSQEFYRQERFVYVGKGWGDYERDSSGRFVPYPYGSYRKEVLYFPRGEPAYDLSLSVSGERTGVGLSAKVGNGVERYSVDAHSVGSSYSVRGRVAEDRVSTYPYSERSAEGRIGRRWYLSVEAVNKVFGADSVLYFSSETGYSRGWVEGGMEVMRGKSYALSPVLRTRGWLSVEGGYRVFFGEAGPEKRYKPPGPFLTTTLRGSRGVGDVMIEGALTGGYDLLRRWYYTFSFNVSGSL